MFTRGCNFPSHVHGGISKPADDTRPPMQSLRCWKARVTWCRWLGKPKKTWGNHWSNGSVLGSEHGRPLDLQKAHKIPRGFPKIFPWSKRGICDGKCPGGVPPLGDHVTDSQWASFRVSFRVLISPWDMAVQNQVGWAPKTGSFYTGVSLCGWAPLGRVVILYRSQGVKLDLFPESVWAQGSSNSGGL